MWRKKITYSLVHMFCFVTLKELLRACERSARGGDGRESLLFLLIYLSVVCPMALSQQKFSSKKKPNWKTE